MSALPRWRTKAAKLFRVRWLQTPIGQAYQARDRAASKKRSRARRARLAAQLNPLPVSPQSLSRFNRH